MRILETQKSIALLAGAVCYGIALSAIVLMPELLTTQSEPKVVGVDGIERDVPPYTAQQQRGRDTYGRQICWHCHSQYVRPVNEEDKRWGPVSQTGEYAFDTPHFFGTRRTGPDLHREGGLRPDDWHVAHFYNPRWTVPASVMPAFPWLFYEEGRSAKVREALSVLDTNGDGIISTKIGDDGTDPTDAVRDLRRLVASQDKATRLDMRGVKPPSRAGEAAPDPMLYAEVEDTADGLVTSYDAGPRPTDECVDLIAYLQRMGTTIGAWRPLPYAPTPNRASPFDEADPRPRRSPAMRAYGFLRQDPAKVKAADDALAAFTKAAKAWDAEHPILATRLVKGGELFAKHCAGCHGAEGRGNGLAAATMLVRPRDFTLAQYRYRSTPVGFLPTDGDLYRTLHRGLPGSSMPSFKELADEQLWLLVDYVKSLYEGDKKFNERTQVAPSTPQRFDPSPDKELARGRALYLTLQCSNCHGLEGRGDGPGWADTGSDYGGRLRPRDLRPRLRPEDGPEVYGLLGRHLERFFGKEAWKGLSASPGWQGLAPTDAAKQKEFMLFLLGTKGRLISVLGEDAVQKALGDRYKKLFERGLDPLEDIRMACATEKDKPALRFRGGAAPEDLYRTVMTGLDGSPMKSQVNDFWVKTEVKLAGREGDKSLGRFDKRFLWTQRAPTGDAAKDAGEKKKLAIVTHDAALREVGVFVVKNDKGEDEEFLMVQPGDDWALVHYVMWLACIPQQRAGN